MLAIHKDVQMKVVNELHDVFSSTDDPIDFDTLNNLPYLEMVIKETLRLFPISAFTLRTTSENIELENYVVPSGSILFLSVYALQHNKKYWGDDAEKFIPERFLPERIKNVHPYAYLPFSGKQLVLKLVEFQFVLKTSRVLLTFQVVLGIALEVVTRCFS